jgi:hypothetical protein
VGKDALGLKLVGFRSKGASNCGGGMELGVFGRRCP